jgi:hypothetical protein
MARPMLHDDAPPVSTALEHVVEAVQRVVTDQIRLARVEAESTAQRMAVGAGMVAGAALFALVAWIAICGAAYVGLRGVIHPSGAFGVVALVNLALAGGLGFIGVRRLTGGTGEDHDGAS